MRPHKAMPNIFTYLQIAKHLLLLHLFTLLKDVLEGWLYYNEGLNKGQWLLCTNEMQTVITEFAKP